MYRACKIILHLAFCILLYCALCYTVHLNAATADFVLDTIVVVAKDGSVPSAPSQTTIVYQQLAVSPIETPRDLSSSVPNLVMPAYGSAMTSAIYVRGIGSRLDQPVIQISIDGIPVLDKNAFDADLLDLRHASFKPGPQGTLYGRNSMGGVLELTTFQPMDVSTWSVRASVGYSTANTVDARASVYHRPKPSFAYSIGVLYGRTDGFYTNAYTGKLIDGNNHASGRFVMQFKPNERWLITTTTMGSYITQGAFPYALARSRVIAYNSPTGYERLLLSQSLRAIYQREGYHLELVGTYQFLADHMLMDQDYTPRDIFTLEQTQRQHNAYIDAILHGESPVPWYSYSVGLTGFMKANTMSAPVTFLREGIESVILTNANKGIHTAFPEDSLEITNETIAIPSDFQFLNLAGALYHVSRFKPVRGLTIDVGLRADVEYSAMDYRSSAALNYRMTAYMSEPEPYHIGMKGFRSQTHLTLLPNVHLQYDWHNLSLYATAARGSKAGGYNPQIFSTIMQTRLMNALMQEMGVSLVPNEDGIDYSSADITAYKPETAWSCELGTRWTALKPSMTQPHHRLSVAALAFYTDVTNQQVTVFPSGQTTGRMMANAAHTRSAGAETQLNYRYLTPHWLVLLHAAYGFTDARFIAFNNGLGVYDGKLVPYAPQHTMAVQATGQYTFNAAWSLSLTATTHGQGRIYWDEANTQEQPYYQLLDLSANLTWRMVTLQLYARNIVGTKYDVFYFVSMDNAFLQAAPPRQIGLNLKLIL